MHDDETLEYLDHALYRIDRTKAVFKQFRPVDKATDEGHFNFPKFHAMTHYASGIREYGAADNFVTEHSKAGHKYHVKAFYGRTNKRQGYEDQICLHNTRRTNMLGMDNILVHRKTRYTIQSSNDIEAQVSVPTKKQNLIQLGWTINDTERQYLLQRGIDLDFCRTAAEVALRLDIKGFINALVVFVRECRNRFDEVPVTNASVVRRESNSLWVEGLPVTLYPSI